MIVISIDAPLWNDGGNRHVPCFLAIPLYSVKDKAEKYKYSESFLRRVQAYEYPTLFYLPEWKNGVVHESIARFDRACIIEKQQLENSSVKLTDDALFCMTRWFHFYCGGKLDEIIQEYRTNSLRGLQ